MTNVFSSGERRELAGRARTIHERMDGPPNVPGDEPVDPDEVVAEWQALFPDEDAFEERLARDEFTRTTVQDQIAATRWPADEPLPDWVDDVENLIRYLEEDAIHGRFPVTGSGETPFVELLTAIAGFAHDRLPESTLPKDALSEMGEWLVSRLERLCTRPLYVEFKSFVEYHAPELAKADPDEYSDPPTKHYDQFIEALFDGSFRDFCLEYPVLARHLVRVIDYWQETVTEVCERIRVDRTVLREQFDVAGDVVTLEPLADDTHARGRVPVRVVFDSGSVIHKPRSIDVASVFYTVLDRLERHASIPRLRTPAHRRCDGYGWMEEIEYHDPTGDAGVRDYYERAGALLCLSYVFGLTDCQKDNLIVEENDPVIIDAETLFQLHVDSDLKPIDPELYSVATHSILTTALLPLSVGEPNGENQEKLMATIAGLGQNSDEVELPHVSRPAIESVNTDVMTVEVEQPTVDGSTNTPTVEGGDRPPAEYVDDIVCGFERTYDAIRELHADGRLQSEICTPEMVSGLENRLIYRFTREYESVLRDATARRVLRDGAWLTVEFETLAASLFEEQVDIDQCWPLYTAERKALRRLDVPRFATRPDQQTVFHDGEPITRIAGTPGYEKYRRRLARLSETDRRQQVWLIRKSFESFTEPGPLPPAVEVTDRRLLDEAVALFDDAVDAAIEADDSNHWVAITGSNPVTLVSGGSSLYHGGSGIALTAAALYDATGQERYRRHVADILDPVLEDQFAERPSPGIGGTRGLGSLVFALSVVAELLDDDSYREGARKIAGRITAERVADDDSLDVMEGTAGALLGLLAHYERFGGEAVLNRARSCGDRLCEARVAVDGYRVWETVDDEPTGGFAHGTSGIAYALARLAAVTGEQQYADAAREAFSFEQSTLSSAPEGDTDSNDGHRRGTLDWCHGLAGIALSRLGAAERLDDDRLHADADRKLSDLVATKPSPFDNLCCGNLARVEALLVGSRHSDECDVSDAVTLAGRCLARREKSGTLELPGHSETFANPTFFDGVAGAAYTLLRLREPESLPCALLLD